MKYEVTGRGGKGRELLQRGQSTRVIDPIPDAPQGFGTDSRLETPARGSQNPRSAPDAQRAETPTPVHCHHRFRPNGVVL